MISAQLARKIVARDLHLFERRGQCVGYGTVSGVFLRFSHDEFAALQKANSEDALSDSECQVVEAVAERISRQKVFRQGLTPPRSVQMILTDACNFKCSYCYGMYYDARPGERLMPLEVAIKVIDFAHKSGVRHIGFFGGEPLLNFSAIQAAIRRATEIGAHFDYGMTTNGALVTDEIAAYCRDNGIRVSVSLDGPKHVHDAARKRKSGAGTFDDVMLGVERLKSVGRLDLLEATRSAKAPGTVKESLDFLLSHSNCVSCTCVEGRGAACFSDEIVKGEGLKEYYRDMFAAYREAQESGSGASIGGIGELVAGLGGGVSVVREHVCSALLDRISVGIDGTIYPCPETMNKTFAICNVMDDDCVQVFPERRALVMTMLRKDNLEKHWFANLTDVCVGRISVDNQKRKSIDDAGAIGDALEELLCLVVEYEAETVSGKAMVSPTGATSQYSHSR